MIDVRVPGDKSIAHRFLILATLAEGESYLSAVPASLQSGWQDRRSGVRLPPLSIAVTVARWRGSLPACSRVWESKLS